mmetsp:Transcript_36577/g.103292  ORF Transcript_36577/g.103292 Transcript_36577/m.103292 type:complete len:142 (-) Transcript_36577:721-1146(-)
MTTARSLPGCCGLSGRISLTEAVQMKSIGWIRDTSSLEVCQQRCEANSLCSALVYNPSRSCFLIRSCNFPRARGNDDHSARILHRDLEGHICNQSETFPGKTCLWPVSPASRERSYPLVRTFGKDYSEECANYCRMYKSPC